MKKLNCWDIAITGLSLVIIVFYAPFAISSIMHKHLSEIDIQYLISFVFISMAFSTLLSAKITKTGLIVAPAIGMTVFGDQIISKGTNLYHYLFATFLAGCFSFIVSAFPRKDKEPFRKQFVKLLPQPIRTAVKGGVGAMLASAAMKSVSDIPEEFIEGLVFCKEALTPEELSACKALFRQEVNTVFYFSSIAIIFFDILIRFISKHIKKYDQKLFKITLLLMRSTQIFVPIYVLFYFSYHKKWFEFNFDINTKIPLDIFMVVPSGLINEMPQPQELGNILFLSLIILFVFVVDTPGSPYDLLGEAELESSEIKKRTKDSFLVNSFTTMVNPFFGLFSSVYYAENNIITRDNENNKWKGRSMSSSTVAYPHTAILCAFVFLFFGVSFSFIEMSDPSMAQWLKISVSPILFLLGIHLVAKSMKKEKEKDQEKEAQHDSMSNYFTPLCFCIFLIESIGFVEAIPFSIVFFYSANKSIDNWKSSDMVIFIINLIFFIYFSALKII